MTDTDRYWKPGDIWQDEQWSSTGFYRIPPQGEGFWQIYLVFEGAEYAEQVWAAISNWQNEHVPARPNLPEDLDRQNAIQVSLILENQDLFSIYVYPNPVLARQTITVRTKTILLCKQFEGGPGSYFEAFLNGHKGEPYVLAGMYRQGDAPQYVQRTQPIWKQHIKIKRRDELTPDEVEYVHGKTVMGL